MDKYNQPRLIRNSIFSQAPCLQHKLFLFTQAKITRLNTRFYKCNKNNDYKRSKCTQRFISQELGCIPSWYEDMVSNLQPCQGPKYLDEYRNITKRLSLNGTYRAQSGCFVEKCQQSKWKSQSLVTMRAERENVTKISFKVLTKVRWFILNEKVEIVFILFFCRMLR